MEETKNKTEIKTYGFLRRLDKCKRIGFNGPARTFYDWREYNDERNKRITFRMIVR